jgi:hypothetical protein
VAPPAKGQAIGSAGDPDRTNLQVRGGVELVANVTQAAAAPSASHAGVISAVADGEGDIRTAKVD